MELSPATGVRMCAALLLLHAVLPRGFTSDAAVLAQLSPLLAGVLPFAAIVFVLDGILLGAGDRREAV